MRVRQRSSHGRARPTRLLALGLALALPLGCYADYTPEPTQSTAVGPAPLRRLTNEEYLNALADLFPSVKVTLPALPTDATVAGFDNAAEAQQPSDVRIARYEAIASAYAHVLARDASAVHALTGCADYASPALADACASSFVQKVGSRIFRRPLTSDERDRFTSRFHGWQLAVDFEGATELTLSALLQSPQFIYRPEPAPPDVAAGRTIPLEPYAMATRLSFFLWKSVPDDALLDAASRNQLGTESELRAQAKRMLEDPRAKRVLYSFHRQWLGLDRVLLDEHSARTAAVDPAWTPATQAAVNLETQLFVENTLAGGGTFKDLFTSRQAWVNGEAARVYRIGAPSDPAQWTQVELPQTERAGLLTRAAFLSGYSHRGATSPPVRGNWLQLRLLCQLPLSPPPGVDLSQPKAQPGDGPQTNRMLFETRTRPPTCQGCHAGLNGYGFGFEHYNAAGEFQTQDNGLPVDATGKITGTDVDGPFNGAIELSARLSQSAVVQRCATERWVRFAVGRAPDPAEALLISTLAEDFHTSEGDVRALLVDLVASDTFRLQKVTREVSSP
jgi:hypothetical protein